VRLRTPQLKARSKPPLFISLLSALTLPAKLKYSSPHLQICQTHIAPHVQREAHGRVPRRTRLAQDNKPATAGMFASGTTCSIKGEHLFQLSQHASRTSEHLFQAIFMAMDEVAVLRNKAGEDTLAHYHRTTPGADYVFTDLTQSPPNREQAT
jgi:hypothetical protein